MDQAPDAQQLSRYVYDHIVRTMCALLPPPLVATPEALLARDQAAIAKIAAMAPANADEADIAAHCILARAQAEYLLRLLCQHAGDLRLVRQLNTQCALMERTALMHQNQLRRVQAARVKRARHSAAVAADKRTHDLVLRMMLEALESIAVPAALPPPVMAPRPDLAVAADDDASADASPIQPIRKAPPRLH